MKTHTRTALADKTINSFALRITEANPDATIVIHPSKYTLARIADVYLPTATEPVLNLDVFVCSEGDTYFTVITDERDIEALDDDDYALRALNRTLTNIRANA